MTCTVCGGQLEQTAHKAVSDAEHIDTYECLSCGRLGTHHVRPDDLSDLETGVCAGGAQ
jgi:uncharacterized Zn finger protein